jgi:hypothetical protein
MRLKTSAMIWIFIWCLFMGITVGSIGIGAIYPPANLIAKPFVCPGGKMDVVEQVYRPYPGTTITTITWYCTDEKTGVKKELSIWPMSLAAGTIYGLLLFAAVYIGMLVLAKRSASGLQSLDGSTEGVDTAGINALVAETERLRDSAGARREQLEGLAGKMKASRGAVAKMKELKELRQADLISEAEYEKKRAEILKDL